MNNGFASMQALRRLRTGALLYAFAGVIMFGAGCKKSAEDLEKAWPGSVKAVDSLAAQYPGFKAALEERKAAGQALFEEAKALVDDAKRDKLDSATSVLKKGFISKLRGLDKSISGLRSDLMDATTGAADEKFLEAAKMLSKEANRTLDQVEARLKTGAANATDADAVLAKVTSDIKSIRDQLKKLKRGSKKASKANAAGSKAPATNKAHTKDAHWTCGYCSSSNKQSATKCESCGASRSQKK